MRASRSYVRISSIIASRAGGVSLSGSRLDAGLGSPPDRTRGHVPATVAASSWSDQSRPTMTEGGREAPGSRPMASSMLRNRALSISGSSRRSTPCESKSTDDAGAARPVLRGTAQRGHEPEVIEDHGADLEDELLRRVEGLLDQLAQGRQLIDAARVALRRRAAPRSRPGGRCWRGTAPGRRGAGGRCRGAGPPGCAASARARSMPGAICDAPAVTARGRSPRGRRCRTRRQAADAREAVVDLDDALEEAREHALLALEHLALRVEEQLDGAWSVRRLVRDLIDLGPVRRRDWPRGSFELAFDLGAPRLMPLDLDEHLLHEHVDLGVLFLDATDVRLELGAQGGHAGRPRAAGSRPPSPHRVARPSCRPEPGLPLREGVDGAPKPLGLTGPGGAARRARVGSEALNPRGS